MKDNKWDLINGQDAHDIEVLNYANQVNVIEALFKLTMYHHKDEKGVCMGHPNTRALKELHRTGTLFLLHNAGQYRENDVVVGDGNIVVFTPPTWQEVDQHMVSFETDMASKWVSSAPIELAAFCLWKLNWVHPFKNGNGRTARAFAYACLCLKYGFMLPGSPTVIDLIMADGVPYQEALRVADAEYAASGTPDLTKMENYLRDLLMKQLSSI